jgi:spoIIIJ-associated protein
VSQRENMAAVTDPVNPDELPAAGEATAGSGEPAAPGPAAADPGGPTGGAIVDDSDATGPRPGDGEDVGDGDSEDATGPGPADGEDVRDGDSEDVGDGDGGDPGQEPAERPRNAADLEQESEIAADYVEGLLDVADLDGDIDMDVEGDRALVSVVGATLSELVGRNGEVLEALQELTRLAVHRQTGVRTRIMLDVGGYRARRRTELTALGREAAEDVSRTGVARRLDPMTPFERKIVHDAVAAAGLHSESEGEEPNRRVVVLPVS